MVSFSSTGRQPGILSGIGMLSQVMSGLRPVDSGLGSSGDPRLTGMAMAAVMRVKITRRRIVDIDLG